MEQAARQRRSRGCAGTEGHQVGVGEESAGPDPGAAGLVGVAVQDQLGPVPGVPAQGATPAGVLDQGRNRPGTARRVAGLGPTLTAARVRRTRRHDQTVPAADLQHPRSRPVQCTLGSHEHAPTSTDQTRQRIPHTRSLHRHGDAHPRRPVPGTAKPPMKTAGGPLFRAWDNALVVGTVHLLLQTRANRRPLTSLRITSSYPSVNNANARTKYTTTCAGSARDLFSRDSVSVSTSSTMNLGTVRVRVPSVTCSVSFPGFPVSIR